MKLGLSHWSYPSLLLTPGDVELADFTEDVDHEVVCGGVVAVTGLGFGPVEEGEGDFGDVLEAD